MDVREMKPGRELDALVAEKIFDKQFYRAPMTEWRGRYVYKEFWDDSNSYYNEWHRSQEIGEWEYCGPNYSTDISAAWKVVEKIKRKEIRGWGDIRLIWGNYGPGTTPKGPCGAMVYPNELAWICVIEQDVKGKSEFVSFAAETAPHAICIASLLATEDKA